MNEPENDGGMPPVETLPDGSRVVRKPSGATVPEDQARKIFTRYRQPPLPESPPRLFPQQHPLVTRMRRETEDAEGESDPDRRRALILIAELRYIADALKDDCADESTRARFRRQVGDAWCALHGPRDMESLIAMSVMVSVETGHAWVERTVSCAGTREEGLEAGVTKALEMLARNYPERAQRVSRTELAAAIVAWPQKAGRPSGGGRSKWAHIKDLMFGIGVETTAENLCDAWKRSERRLNNK